jgi:hypothetical protein
MCIHPDLFCNGIDNCRFRNDEDEDKCKVSWSNVPLKIQAQIRLHPQPEAGIAEHLIIISVVFAIIVAVLVIAFVVNCMRKIMRDHKIIRVSILDIKPQHECVITSSRQSFIPREKFPELFNLRGKLNPIREKLLVPEHKSFWMFSNIFFAKSPNMNFEFFFGEARKLFNMLSMDLMD